MDGTWSGLGPMLKTLVQGATFGSHTCALPTALASPGGVAASSYHLRDADHPIVLILCYRNPTEQRSLRTSGSTSAQYASHAQY